MLLTPFLTAMVLATGQPADTDRWWSYKIANSPTGYEHDTVEHLANGDVRTTMTMHLEIGRSGSKITMHVSSQYEEDSNGRFLRCTTSSLMSKNETHSRVERMGSTLEIVSEAGGRSYKQTVPFEGELFGPEALDNARRSKLRKLGDKVAMNVFSPASNKAVVETIRVASLSPKFVETDQIEGVPGVVTLTVDESGSILERDQDLPFGIMSMTPVDREQALASVGGQLPPDSYDQTLVRSNIRLPDPRSIERIKLEIITKRPDLGFPDFTAYNQRVISQTKNRVVLEIWRVAEPKPTDGVTKPSANEYCQPNSLVQSDDADVVAIAKQCADNAVGLYAAARRQQSWLAQNLRGDMGVTLAPASETVKTHGGTCIAFAILLSSMQRAVGIPSRIVEGYGYEQGIWGGHAWTEIFLDGRWIPLDSALYSSGTADAARFAFARSSMASGGQELNMGGQQAFGNIKVNILEYTLHGKTYRVPSQSSPYAVKGNVYSNPWLGVKVTKDSNGAFTDLAKVYPDPTIVAIKYPHGTVKVQVNSGGPSAEMIKNSEQKQSWRRGQTIWTVSAEGPNAKELIARTRKHIKFAKV